MQILIPMAGAGSRFSIAGYDKPKPFIEFLGKTMIEHVIENLGYKNDFVLVLLDEHYIKFSKIFDLISINSSDAGGSITFVSIASMTQGPADTCLRARSVIRPNDLLMIANCDQMQKMHDDSIIERLIDSQNLDGLIFTFYNESDKNSYVKIDETGLVTETAEKVVISNYATTGIYVWKHADDFFESVEEMMNKNIRANNEFYVCPAYNEAISNGARIGIYNPKEHWPIGTPLDLNLYIEKHLDGII